MLVENSLLVDGDLVCGNLYRVCRVKPDKARTCMPETCKIVKLVGVHPETCDHDPGDGAQCTGVMSSQPAWESLY